MKRSKNILYFKYAITAIISLVMFAGCASPYEVKQEAQVLETTLLPFPTAQEPMRCVAPSAVFVNDSYYRLFEARQHIVPKLDNLWVYLGEVQSTVPGYESPTENFQVNWEGAIGAKIYHTHEGRVPVHDLGDDYLGREVIGDSIIVVFSENRYLYLSEETYSKVEEIFNSVKRSSLLIDGILYSLIRTGGNFYLNDTYTFLGKVTSTISLYESPTENLQANRDIMFGLDVYKTPSEALNDIVVFGNGTCYFYRLLTTG